MILSARSCKRSSNAWSAQWMSSITTTTSCFADSAEKNERQAAWVSERTWRGDRSRNETAGSSTPTV